MSEKRSGEPGGQGPEPRRGSGPFQQELRRPSGNEGLRDREEIGGRAFERPEPTAAGLSGRAAIAYIAEPFAYPLSREDFLACAGDKAFEIRRGESFVVRDVMAKVQASSFETREALVEALLQVLGEGSDGEGPAT